MDGFMEGVWDGRVVGLLVVGRTEGTLEGFEEGRHEEREVGLIVGDDEGVQVVGS
jgi:hypothetical protein